MGISPPHLALIISFLLFRCGLSMVRLGPDDQNAPGIVSSAPSVHASIRSILPPSHWLTSGVAPSSPQRRSARAVFSDLLLSQDKYNIWRYKG
ncbi:hypothetical protein BDV40DRAFT_273530 [Aspergillus tamarii]|uniref:Secreted protein n=1 Tax=Aspergillus tamarii TaxID=41984 RepID=A0A5N6ULL8_ASPTM|nr:hypothetical protein BDV40DRAFT_273530 [Aspergillus tamarii]